MFIILKYIDYAMKVKQGYEAPNELIAETTFAPIESFFVISFIVLGLLSGGSLFVGFYFGYLFFKIIGFILLFILLINIIIFRFIKKTIENISQKVTNNIQSQYKKYSVNQANIINVSEEPTQNK